MRRTKTWLTLLSAALVVGSVALVGCKGDDGDDGKSAYELAVDNGFTGTEQEWLDSQQGKSAYEVAVDNGFSGTATDWLLTQEDVGPEICSFCHNGEVARNGSTHQELYNELFQQDVILVSNIMYSNDGVNDTVTFDMTMDGADFDCTQADSLNVRWTTYTNTAPNSRFTDGVNLRGSTAVTSYLGGGTCEVVQAGTVDLSANNGLVVVYGEDEILESVGHISLGKYPFGAFEDYGPDGVDYSSAANATGCEQCHTTPYYKHGYIRGDMSAGGGADFYACKVCHLDDVSGSHPDWQIAVNDPQRWAEIFNGDDLTAAEETQYAYKRRLMNDVHMSHSMEFPYPQPIRTCATCHAGKLEQTLSDDNFILETCLSCHPVTGGTDTADANGNFAVDTTGYALKTIWENLGVSPLHLQADGSVTTTACNSCHHAADYPNAGDAAGPGKVFSAIHTGYDPLIYYKDTDGSYKHYRDAITASVDSVTVSGNTLDIKVSATGTAGSLSATDITPTIQVSFYGYDTKDFLVSNHTGNANGDRMEKTIGTDNPLFTEVDGDGSDGTWEVTLDMAAYAAGPSDMDIPADIAAGVIKKAEVIFRPTLNHPTITTVSHGGDVIPAPVGLNAASKTVDVTADATDPFVENYFAGDSALVTVSDTQDASGRHHGCNSCHDQLAITFHTGDRGGSIVVCRSCHVVTSGGSHLEGQSRSIDSYVHAIHRFQAFDVDNIDFTDPVEKAKYEEHVEFLFPDFATINCERCHTQHREVDKVGGEYARGTYDIPDQSKSMPGLLSGTDEISGMAIPETPEVVVGPAARACGGCHRAEALEEDDLGGYVAFNEHAKRFGYRVENDANDEMLYAIIDYIMGLWQ